MLHLLYIYSSENCNYRNYVCLAEKGMFCTIITILLSRHNYTTYLQNLLDLLLFQLFSTCIPNEERDTNEYGILSSLVHSSYSLNHIATKSDCAKWKHFIDFVQL